MGIIGLIGVGIEVAKLVTQIIGIIKALKKSGEPVDVKELVSKVNDGISEYKKTGVTDKLVAVKDQIKKQCHGVACPSQPVWREHADTP